MLSRIRSSVRETLLLLRQIPSIVVALFCVSVVLMNLLANKTIYQSEALALDGGFVVSWVSFLCMDVITRQFGPRASTRVSVFALLVNLAAAILCALVSAIPTQDDFSAFNTIFGGVWFILLSSSTAFLVSAVVNNTLNAAVGRLFVANPRGRLAFFTRSYVSTFVGQFVDNLVFAGMTFMLFAPIFWDGFHWTLRQCVTCSLFGATFELLMEIIFSPLGYAVAQKWAREGIGSPTEGIPT